MRPLHVFFGILVAVIWGANFTAAEYALAFFPPFLLTTLRFALVSLLLVPLVKRPALWQIKRMFPIAVMSTFNFSLLFVALSQGLDIPSGALVGQLGVPFACVLGAIFHRDRIGWWRVLGIVIAFGGIAIVAGTPNILSHPAAFLLAVASAFTWAVSNVLIKRVHGVDSMAILAWVGLLAVPMLFLLSLVFEVDAWPSLASVPLTAACGFLFTALASTIVAYGLWFYLLARYTVSQVTPLSLLTPIFSIGFGQWFFAQELTQAVLIGGVITILGVAIIVIRRPRTLILGEAT